LAAASSAAPEAVAAVAAPLPLRPFIEPPPVVQPAGWFNFLASRWWARWLVLGSAPLVGLAMVVGVWSLFTPRSQRDRATVATESAADKASAGQPRAAEKKPLPKTLPARLDRRWLPDRTALVFSVRASGLAAHPESEKLIRQADPPWHRSIGAVLASLGLRLDSVERLTWASTDLAIWPERSVVVLELAPGHDTGALAHSGEAADVGMGEFACRRMSGTAWPNPLVIIDRRTIVSGDEELLRGLARRPEVHLESAPLDRLLNTFAPDADAVLLLDLGAARAARWNLPMSRLDVWPAGKRPWRVIWEVPDGLGLTVHWSEPLRSEVALVCEGETAAERVRAALDELVPAVKELLPKQAEALQESLRAGRLTAAAATPYRMLLDDGRTTLEAAHWQVADGTVWLRLNWGRPPLAVAAAAADSFPALRADWLAAARGVDEARHGYLLEGLMGYQKAEGHLPPGAVGGALLPPETRLSWIAAMLPYYGHDDWHRQLEFGYPWNGTQNRGVAHRPLAEVTNPALGPATTAAGFPVTHYVGVAGVGADAGGLAADQPGAGVFGYGRSTRAEEITRGAANTIAILGVSDRCGPWASGGEPTVRPLTTPPYVNGPDGFGSGQPDGMFAGMADGSVRFISKDIDPRVLEQLATIRGHDDVTAAALQSKPQPAEKPPGAAAGPEHAKPQSEEKPPPPAAPPVAENPAEPAVDVDARLADKIPQIELLDTPLGDALDLLSAMSTLPVTLDPDALLACGVSLRDPVTVRLTGASVGKVLEAIVAGRKLAFVAENGQLLITSPAEYRETLRTRRYTVSDLTGSDAKAVAELAGLVQKLVAPESWQANGGRGAVQPDQGALSVVQTGAVHDQIIMFCEKLRTARGKPLRSRLDSRLFSLATRTARAQAALGQEVSVNFPTATPLAEILRYLKKQAEVEILVDRSALVAAGMADDPKAVFKSQKQPLSTALAALLEPLGLGYRVVDGRTIQVTTRKAVAARFELEFYPLGSLPGNGQPAAALIERIKSRVGGPTWSDAGGPGQAHFDPPSACLIVLQSQPAQFAIEALLAELTRGQRPGTGD
jgi:hypothetical protein